MILDIHISLSQSFLLRERGTDGEIGEKGLVVTIQRPYQESLGIGIQGSGVGGTAEGAAVGKDAMDTVWLGLKSRSDLLLGPHQQRRG